MSFASFDEPPDSFFFCVGLLPQVGLITSWKEAQFQVFWTLKLESRAREREALEGGRGGSAQVDVLVTSPATTTATATAHTERKAELIMIIRQEEPMANQTVGVTVRASTFQSSSVGGTKRRRRWGSGAHSPSTCSLL